VKTRLGLFLKKQRRSRSSQDRFSLPRRGKKDPENPPPIAFPHSLGHQLTCAVHQEPHLQRDETQSNFIAEQAAKSANGPLNDCLHSPCCALPGAGEGIRAVNVMPNLPWESALPTAPLPPRVSPQTRRYRRRPLPTHQRHSRDRRRCRKALPIALRVVSPASAKGWCARGPRSDGRAPRDTLRWPSLQGSAGDSGSGPAGTCPSPGWHRR